jgi:hypothetical protein
MTSLPRGLIVLGFVIALAGAAQTAAAAPPGIVHLADDDVNPDSPADMTPGDAPAGEPAAMPADSPSDMPDDVATATPTVIPTSTSTPTPTATATATATATPTVNPAALQQVIQHSNDEQVQAVATRNLSLTSDTVTPERFQELTRTLQDMLDHQVTSIALLKLDWGPITVAANGSGATVTSYETWRIVSQAGSIDYDPARNEYTLVLDNGTWKIKSDVQVLIPPPASEIGVPPQ